MSNKQLCITFAGGVYEHTYIYNYNCSCLVINKFKSYFCGEMFDAPPSEEPVTSKGRGPPVAHEGADLVTWADLNMFNKDPRTNRGPSCWGH
jgi:hypothetical protein